MTAPEKGQGVKKKKAATSRARSGSGSKRPPKKVTPKKKTAPKASQSKRAETTKTKKRTSLKKKEVTQKKLVTTAKRTAPTAKETASKTVAPGGVTTNRRRRLAQATYSKATALARMPRRAERHMGTFARSAGVTFVLVGGLLTMFFSQQVWGYGWMPLAGVKNTAAVCDSTTMSTSQYLSCITNNTQNNVQTTSSNTQNTTQTTSSNTQNTVQSTSSSTQSNVQTTSSNTQNTTQTTSSNTQATVNKTPTATFTENKPSPLSGNVQITVTVANATQVNLLAYEGTSNTPTVLGTAHAGSVAGTWVYNWDTTNVPDGTYRLAADIFNAYYTSAPYRTTDSMNLTVNNTQTSATSSPTTQVVAQPSASTTVLTPQPLWGKATIGVQVPGATGVGLYVHNRTTGATSYLGQAYQKDFADWRYVWDTTPFNNGSYSIQAYITNSAGSYHAPSIPVTVDHSARPATSTTTATSSVQNAIPSATLTIPNTRSVSGVVNAKITTPGAQSVELYAMPNGSRIDQFVGHAQKADVGVWQVTWDSQNMPNGTYTFYAQVTNTFGTYKSNKVSVKIYNKPQQSPLSAQEKAALAKLQNAHLPYASSSNPQPVSTSTKRMLTALAPYYQNLDVILQRYAAAYRVHNNSGMQTVKQQLAAERTKIVNALTKRTFPSSDAAALDALVRNHINSFINNLPKVDALLQARLGANIFEDSDHDGISNYDEIHVYHTNPYSADTDGDGFTDGAEIMSGHDPLNPNPQSVIQYQLPQDNGVQRSDLLSVTSIEGVGKPTTSPTSTVATAQHETPASSTSAAHTSSSKPVAHPSSPANEALTQTSATPAVITGRGLPNSFVTLYIFSMPIVVTVKTNADGSWQYRFDKELPNGKHTIYVGITDNAGHIIAKSAPFNFVKKAYAYTPTTEGPVSNVASQTDSGSLLSQSMMYLIASISIVGIGLVLIILGFHLESRRRMLAKVVNPSQAV